MREVKFTALVKKVSMKALVSLDKGFEARLQTGDPRIAELMMAPADAEVEFTARISFRKDIINAKRKNKAKIIR